MALKYATERIKSLVNLIYGDYSSSSRLGDRLGFKQAAYILLSYLIYNKNIVIDDPPKAIVVFIDMILTKAPAFRKLHNSLRYDIQAAYYAPKLLDALIRIMPGFIEFDKEERDALVEEGKRLQAAIKAGSAVSEAKVMNITKHIQTLNEAEKNGGIVAAHSPNPIDTMKYFNAECVYTRHTWQTTWGRLLTSIDAKNISTIKRASIDALSESSIETDCFSSNNNICAVLSPLNITFSNLTDKKIIVLIDAPRDTSSDQYIKNLMATITLSLFKLINNGINIIVFFSTMKGTMITNSQLLKI
jgi:hypothetical protein